MKSFILFIIVLDFLPLTYCRKPMGGLSDVYYSIFYEAPDKMNIFYHPEQPIPEEFDARKQWPECKTIGQIQYQGECNTGFIFAYTAAFADRLCINTSGSWQLPISAEDVINCCYTCWNVLEKSSCNGVGFETNLIQYMATRGVPTGGGFNSGVGCVPVSQNTISGRLRSKCGLTCTNPNYPRSYFSDKLLLDDVSFSTSTYHTQIEIMKNGPVLTLISMVSELLTQLDNSSFTGVFDYKPDVDYADELLEVVRVIGWGVEKGVRYWLIANTRKATNFFKLKRGKNLLYMESIMAAIFPNPQRKPELNSTSGCEAVGAVNYSCFAFLTFHLILVNLVFFGNFARCLKVFQ